MKKSVKIRGFEFAGCHCGIKEQKGRKDLGVIYATQTNTAIAGVYTTNKILAAPVLQCQKNTKNGIGRLIVINSGIANAATGAKGKEDARKTEAAAAKIFNVKKNDVCVCSTGRIGERVPVQKIIKGLDGLKSNLNEKSFYDCANAILTTDKSTKTVVKTGRLQGKPFTLAIMAKGAGMIQPNMATMLCYIMTDLKISKPVLNSLLKESVSDTLNSLSVDGDTSTNDTVLIMASGLANNKALNKASADYKKTKKLLTEALLYIAKEIALDGEGATKCFEVNVVGAKSSKDAQKISKAIANSLLVKTAMFGGDPNWGRIVCAAGYSGAAINEKKTSVSFKNISVFTNGKPINKNEARAAAYLKKNSEIEININLGLGKHNSRAIGSDLTYDYVKLNAEYRT